MIDTIRFKLHNLHTYGQSGYSLVNNDKVTIGGMKYREYKNKLSEIKTDEFVNCSITSASYDINYSLNIALDYAVFEFSIPKYIYGHNVEHFPLTEDNLHYDLCKFIEVFFRTEFFLEVNLCHIEIDRIDFCYNYKFASFLNREMYKSNMLQKVNDHFRTDNVISYSNNETAMYKTQDFSFKIYDKFEEFIKHDYAKVRKFKGREQADFIRKQAFNTMRSEMTLRKRKLSYEFFATIDQQSQVSAKFKTRYFNLYQVNNQIGGITNKMIYIINRYLKGYSIDIDAYKLKVLSYHNFDKFFLPDRIDDFFNSIKKLKEHMLIEKYYTQDDLKILIKSSYRSLLKQYNKLRSPKKIMLKLGKFESHVQKNAYHDITVIELNEEYLKVLFDKFKSIINGVNDYAVKSKVTTFNILKQSKDIFKELNISYASISRYVLLSEKLTRKQLINEGFYSSSSVRKFNVQIKQFNDHCKKTGLPFSLNKKNISEKIVFVT